MWTYRHTHTHTQSHICDWMTDPYLISPVCMFVRVSVCVCVGEVCRCWVCEWSGWSGSALCHVCCSSFTTRHTSDCAGTWSRRQSSQSRSVLIRCYHWRWRSNSSWLFLPFVSPTLILSHYLTDRSLHWQPGSVDLTEWSLGKATQPALFTSGYCKSKIPWKK